MISNGNFDIKVRVTAQENRNSWGKCGIMVRNDMTAPGSSTGYVIMATTPGNGHTFQYDNNNNGYLDTHVTNYRGDPLPAWVRLQKVGTTFTGYRSSDGINLDRACHPHHRFGRHDSGCGAFCHLP